MGCPAGHRLIHNFSGHLALFFGQRAKRAPCCMRSCATIARIPRPKRVCELRLNPLLSSPVFQHALTSFGGFVARARAGTITTWIIRDFIRRYGVNMHEALESDPRAYASFNEFFTRALKPGARPLAQAQLICPVDGAISQFGSIKHDQIFQAKGHHYSARELVGGDAQLAARFIDGQFATLYLSPRDYHRIHMPCDGRLTRMIYVPGDLYSVNPATAACVPRLFARNERAVCVFESPHGPFVLVLVGATIVGSMATVWHGLIERRARGQIEDRSYTDQSITLRQGEEMGRFLLGSTVVLLFPQRFPDQSPVFNPAWRPQGDIRRGEVMADHAPPA